MNRAAPLGLDVPALLAFCAEHPAGGHDATTRARFLTTLISGPGCVVDLFEAERRVAVAVVIDTLERPGDAVVVEVIGEAPGCDRVAAADAVLDAAVDVARAAGRPRILSGWPHPTSPDLARTLRARGQRLTTVEYKLERAPAPLPSFPPLPQGWRWRDLADDDVQAYADLVARAFDAAAIPLFRPPLAEMRRALLAGRPRPRLLCDGDAIVGTVRATHGPGDAIGELAQIARDPAYRGRGVGQHLVIEALRVLTDAGATTVQLGVVASNERALALYRRFGFTVLLEAGAYEGSAEAAAR